MSTRIPILVLALLLAASPVGADSEPASESVRPHYIDLLGGLSWPDAGRDTRNRGYNGAFIYGAHLDGPWWVEGRLFGSLFETGSRSGTDFYQYGAGVDLVGTYGDRNGFTPFGLIGIGGAVNDVQPDRRDDIGYYTNAGIGFVSPPFTSRGIKLRAEGRVIYDDFRRGQVDYLTAIGISIPLGRTEVVERIVEREVVREVVREVPVEVPVAPPDGDADGVADVRDLCPNTLPGAVVDHTGCIVKKQTLVVDDIHFEFDSDQLTGPAQKILDGVAASLREQPDLRFEIAGHTDHMGSDEYNESLSQARALSVQRHLAGRGIAPERMRAHGYGEAQPIDTNETDAGRARNRRVELRIDAQRSQ